MEKTKDFGGEFIYPSPVDRTVPTTLRTRWATSVCVTVVANVAIVHEKLRGNTACKCYNNVAQEMRKGM